MISQIHITATKKELRGSIKLPSSKSISNRVLIINKLANSQFPIGNLSDSDDTRAMENALSFQSNKIDIGHAGTAMRFLTAYLSITQGEWELTGSARMQQRPIKLLVDALVEMEAKIEYLKNDGFPPLRILGSNLKGGELSLDGSVSSQYISALLMIAPTLEKGLTLKLENEITSLPYIELTLKLMETFGVKSQFLKNVISIEHQQYKPIPFEVEADWSGASYWYEMAVLANHADILLEGLKLDSLQGDCAQAKWFEAFGIQSTQEKTGVRLTKMAKLLPDSYIQDFVENPDIAQTFAVMCVGKGIPFHFYGLRTLKIKETDRIEALIVELGKVGAKLYEPGEGELAWDGELDDEKFRKIAEIDTYHDHRMALSFAPIVLSNRGIKINDPMVVTKSYPNFWEDLSSMGCSLSQSQD